VHRALRDRVVEDSGAGPKIDSARGPLSREKERSMTRTDTRAMASASVSRRTILKTLAVLGAAASDLATFAEALADASPEDVAQLTILIQGGPVADAINNVALPLFRRQFPNVSIQLEVSTGAVAYQKMLAQKNNPVIGGGMFNDLVSARGSIDKMWAAINPDYMPNAQRVPKELLLPGGEGVTFQQTPFGIMYNPDKVEAPTSWTDLWNPKYEGRVAMWDVYFDAYAMAAVAVGKGPSVEDGIKAWEPYRKNIGAWTTSPIAEEDLVHRGEVWLAPHWGAWTEQARLQGKRVAFAFPKEGATLWSNQLQCSVGFSPKITELVQRYLNVWLSDECQTAWLKNALISPAIGSLSIPPELQTNPAVISAADAGKKLIRLDARRVAAKFAATKVLIEQTLKS
jgi:putative spermidine/putrescine transport system substrate-binding protein